MKNFKNLTVHQNCQKPDKKSAVKLAELLAVDKPILFLSAGGSSLDVLKALPSSVSFSDVTVSVLDERVTNNLSDRNFYQLQQIDCIQKQQDTIDFIDPLPDTDVDPAEAGKQFANNLRHWQEDNPSGQAIATVGIGTDGHIAGMIPTSRNKFESRFSTDDIAVGYTDHEMENEFASRITTTKKFFLSYLDQAVAYAVGASKCSVLQQLTTIDEDVFSRPAELLKQVPTNVFTDCRLDAEDR